MIQIAQGAEAVLFQDRGTIIKERLSKSYRLPHLDEALRGFRTRREAKVLQRLEAMDFPAPRVHDFSDQRMSIVMDFVPGQKLRDVLAQGDEFQSLAREMGEKIGKLHQQHIIHGDLTTSNMIVHHESKLLNFIDAQKSGISGISKKNEIFFIDFGLSSFSEKIEDKAVDLFLLDRALESKHYQLYPEIFEHVLDGYKESYPDAMRVLERFEQVKGRGRNKKKN